MKTFGNYTILTGEVPAIIQEMSSGGTKLIVKDAGDDAGKDFEVKGRKEPIKFYPWGQDDDLPTKLIANSYKNNVLASNLDFNFKIAYGDGLQVVRWVMGKNNKLEATPLTHADAPEVFDFLEDNNIEMLLQELIHDTTLLHNGFVELIMNQRMNKCLQLRHKEAAYSRISTIDKDTAKSEWHGYSAKWKDTAPDDLVATPLLDFDNPQYDYKVRTGKAPGIDGKKTVKRSNSYVMHIAMPSPGKFYYQKAYWWSIFESHWFDLSCAIPEFKMNLMKNQMVLKYHIKINRQFFPNLFTEEGITDKAKQVARKKQFYVDMEDFLASKENAGKNLATEFDYDTVNKGVERQDIIITPIENFIKGGEYIEDSEEATNAICYAMGVHPSLQGASPGKSKTINGTEARELFIIKQSMMKPFRDMILQILRLVKYINGWPKDVDFVIPNIMLTTLDKNTGAEKQIGNEKL